MVSVGKVGQARQAFELTAAEQMEAGGAAPPEHRKCYQSNVGKTLRSGSRNLSLEDQQDMSVNKNGGTSILNVSGDAEQWTAADGRATAAVQYTDALIMLLHTPRLWGFSAGGPRSSVGGLL